MTAPANQEPARLLVIEDDPSVPILLNHWLKRNSHANMVIDHAPTPNLGAERAPGAACIILDLTIPPQWRPVDTLALIPKLRVHAPVIVLTGYTEGSNDRDSIFASEVVSECGAEMVVFKNTLASQEGVGWLFTAVSAAMCRRLFERKLIEQSQQTQ